MSKRRVVVTGMGCVTPYGIGVDTMWQNLIKGKSGIKEHNLDKEKHLVKVAGQVPVDIDIDSYVDPKEAKRLDKSIVYALIASEEAFKDSKAKDWYLDGSYNYTIASNLKSIFWNIGIGAFIGTEYIKHPQKEYKFIIGPEIGTEVEFFVVPQVAILASMKEVWNPLSIHKWNTIWNIGVKVLLYK